MTTASASASASAAAPAASRPRPPPPRECDTTSTDPAQYQREKHVAHLKWVWWSRPYSFVTNTGARLNYHDVHRYRVAQGRLPEGLDEEVFTRWMAQKQAVLKMYPPGPFNIAPKGAPSTVEAPDRWVNRRASNQASGATAAPAIASTSAGGGSSSAQPSGQLSANTPSAQLAGAVNQTASGSQAAAAPGPVAPPNVVAAVVAPPAQSLSGSVAVAGQQQPPQTDGAQAGPSNADGSASQPVQVATPVPAPAPAAVQQQHAVPPVTAVVSAPVAQSGVPAVSAPPAAPCGTTDPCGRSRDHGGPACRDRRVCRVVQSHGLHVHWRASRGPAGPPMASQVPQQDTTQPQASAGLAANLHPSATTLQTTPILQVPLADAAAAAFLHRWIVSTTGRSDQRVAHSIVPSEASGLREAWNTEVYHVYWPHGYLCLFFPDTNEAVEFFMEEEMWEDAPRDVVGDVIMGRMCDASWMSCCACRAPPGGFCD
ncbi:hypothetical protein TWF696_009273 [Orbilia brochopaga]|uniref:Uncharacterized protein n=1 Tax=Orbilia brochopaga TaxID=3140254 RepID=A0AAV9UG87_9PEZI